MKMKEFRPQGGARSLRPYRIRQWIDIFGHLLGWSSPNFCTVYNKMKTKGLNLIFSCKGGGTSFFIMEPTTK